MPSERDEVPYEEEQPPCGSVDIPPALRYLPSGSHQIPSGPAQPPSGLAHMPSRLAQVPIIFTGSLFFIEGEPWKAKGMFLVLFQPPIRNGAPPHSSVGTFFL